MSTLGLIPQSRTFQNVVINGTLKPKVVTVTDTGDFTVTKEQAGTLFLIEFPASPATITMPTPGDAGVGSTFRFMMASGTSAANLVIDFGAGNVYARTVPGIFNPAALRYGTFTHANAPLLGDEIEVTSTGTFYRANALFFSGTPPNTAVTFT